jgi:hypothetical protein
LSHQPSLEEIQGWLTRARYLTGAGLDETAARRDTTTAAHPTHPEHPTERSNAFELSLLLPERIRFATGSGRQRQENEMTFRLNLDIDAAPAAVFDFISDFTTTPRWYSAVQRVDRLGGADGLGARYAVHRNLPGGPATNEVEVTTYESGREVAFTSLSGPTPFVYRYFVEPDGDATKLILEGTISGAGLSGPAALLGPLAEGLFKRGMRDNLAVLKAALEH